MTNQDTEVLVSGFFQILHAGHIELLEYASHFGKVTAAVNGNEYGKKRYGNRAMDAEHRRLCLAACRYVDKAIIFEEFEPSELILKLKPKVYVRGYDYVGKVLPEQAALDIVGAHVFVLANKKIKIHSSDYL